ncbi:protocadherin Fat 1 [Nephila pilipes]|uniref:Protocadherin Fat 1 n=1 Tax=Nephila pilipes TaxID=299642 RepID=A0A8X6PRE5_NEPPI|nr:protocadherin Fat 1 [Nephila pilipes]
MLFSLSLVVLTCSLHVILEQETANQLVYENIFKNQLFALLGDPPPSSATHIQYFTTTVTLRTNIKEDSVPFALSSYPAGTFQFFNPAWTICKLSTEALVGSLTQDTTFRFTAPKIRNESLLFSLAVFIPETKQWFITTHKFAVRSECYYILPNQDIIFTSADLAIQDMKSILIQSPQDSGLQVYFKDVIIPADELIFFYNVSESSPPILLSYVELDQLSFILLEEQFLLVDAKRCSDCRFQLLIKPLAVKYECNSTLRLAQGSLELVAQSPPSSCGLLLQAPPFHRVLIKISPNAVDNCLPQKLLLGPLAGVPTQTVWTSCNTTSNAQTEFYISESNLLRVYWDGSVDDVVLRYEFLPSCSNWTYTDNAFGRFCSIGYPNIILGCHTLYSIYVPFGFSIELKLDVVGVTAGALCQNNTLEVVTRNSTLSEKQLMELCLEASDDQIDSFTLHALQNIIDIRIHSNTDFLHKGFCATYKAIPHEPALIVDCDYGWVAGDKFCYKVFEERLQWSEADKACQMKGGHLASITDNSVAHLLDNIIFTSPIYKRSNAFWIGANDLRYENIYEWVDGQPFDFSCKCFFAERLSMKAESVPATAEL